MSHQLTSSPHWFKSHNFDIIFFWIPNHVGIVGNTKVDLLEKTPSLSRSYHPITNILIPVADFLSMSTQSFKINGKSRWNLHPNNKLYKIYPNVSTFPALPNTFTRKEQTTLNRLLIGHSRLTHSYLINKDPAPTCEHCKCILTIEHILCTCTTYEHNRKRYFPNSQLSHILLHFILATVSLILNF